jgi:tagaturonate reductase
MEDEVFSGFIEKLMFKDIGQAIPYAVSPEQLREFGAKVLDRFRNPFLQHRWINITFQNTAKMRMRNVPVLKQSHHLNSPAPKYMVAGFAAYILFMRPVKKEGDSYYGTYNGQFYKINDEQAKFFYNVWKKDIPVEKLVTEILRNVELWGEDLSYLTEFKTGVQNYLKDMMLGGPMLEDI